MKSWLAVLYCLLCSYACTNNPEQAKQKLPTSPEELVRQWQNHIDNNRFEAAKELSTPKGKIEVEGIMKEIVDEDFPDNFISETIFESIICQQSDQQTLCICQVKEEEGRDSFFLVNENDHWLFEKLSFEDLLDEDRLMEELKENLDNLLEGNKEATE